MDIAVKGKVGLSAALAVLLALSIAPTSPLGAVAHAADGGADAAEVAQVADVPQLGETDRAMAFAGGESALAATEAVADEDGSGGDADPAGSVGGAQGAQLAMGANADGAAGNDGEGESAGPDAVSGESAEATSSGDPAKLDPASLPDGTYTVAVSLRNASDLAQSSMASGAIDATDKLSVKDGAYTLGLTLGTVKMGDVTGYVKQIDAFSSYAVLGNKLQITGEAMPVWTAKSQGDGGPAAFPVDSSAKVDGYAAIQLYSDEMPVSPQKAALFIDWSTLQKATDEPIAFDGDASGAQQPATPAVEDPAQQPVEQPAPAKEEFQVGHVYSVPIYFTKAGTGETSMASQYFGGSAYVRPRSDGAFDVRFSTNRPDYVESVSYNGAVASVTSDSGSSREFCIRIPRATTDTVVRLDFVIAPMKELGAGSVSGDMHLHLSRAIDLGADTGQVTSSSGGGGSLPATGDPLAPMAYLLALVALASAGALLTTRRRAFAAVEA